MRAEYVPGNVILPDAACEGYAFGGWYLDPECVRYPVGVAGREYTPKFTGGNKETHLYAKWSNIHLDSVVDLAVDDYKGGVDLFWRWSMITSGTKTYKIYQSLDADKPDNEKSWRSLGEGYGKNNEPKVDDYKNSTAGEYTYKVPATGYYNISLSGAKGADVKGQKGGNGATVNGTFYLTKGDSLFLHLGAIGGGAKSTNESKGANGGDFSYVTLQSSQEKLLVAGGGGGAQEKSDGGAAGGLVSKCTWEKDARGLVINTRGNGGGAGGYGAMNGVGGQFKAGHVHEYNCYHHHIGIPNGTVNGQPYSSVACGCYTKQVGCSGEPEVIASGTYGFTDRNNDGICDQCNSTEAEHDTDSHYWETAVCPICGWRSDSGSTHDTVYYLLSCGCNDNQLICKQDTTSVSIPSKGGYCYVSDRNCKSSCDGAERGTNAGCGKVVISVEAIGYATDTRLDDVSANDKAAPDKIDEGSIVTLAMKDDYVVTFNTPRDNGTVYCHKVEAYDVTKPQELQSVSNVTTNTVTEGVKGYFYLVDANPATLIDSSNTHGMVRSAECRVPKGTTAKYLHLNAVDIAGNVDKDKTVHVLLDGNPNWSSIHTQQMFISSIVGGRNYNNVYASATQAKTYYVRADGVSPFLLSYRSYMDGSPRQNYMIDYQNISVGGAEAPAQTFSTRLAYTGLGTKETPNVTILQRMANNSSPLCDAMYTGASRKDYNKSNGFYQAFFIGSDQDGKTLPVFPVAGITNDAKRDDEVEISYSDRAEDFGNGITLIPDANGPVITGMDDFSGIDHVNVGTGQTGLEMDVSDALSGLKECTVTFQNKWTGDVLTVHPDANGHLSYVFDDSIPTFRGDFGITVEAKDNVGNVTVARYGQAELSLDTELTPSTVKPGGAALLTVRVFGYPDDVTVEIPEEIPGNSRVANGSTTHYFEYRGDRKYSYEEGVSIPISPSMESPKTFTVRITATKNGVSVTRTEVLKIEGEFSPEYRVRIR